MKNIGIKVACAIVLGSLALVFARFGAASVRAASFGKAFQVSEAADQKEVRHVYPFRHQHI